MYNDNPFRDVLGEAAFWKWEEAGEKAGAEAARKKLKPGDAYKHISNAVKKSQGRLARTRLNIPSDLKNAEQIGRDAYHKAMGLVDLSKTIDESDTKILTSTGWKSLNESSGRETEPRHISDHLERASKSREYNIPNVGIVDPNHAREALAALKAAMRGEFVLPAAKRNPISAVKPSSESPALAVVRALGKDRDSFHAVRRAWKAHQMNEGFNQLDESSTHKLVHKDGRELKPGDEVTNFRGQKFVLHSFEPGSHEGSTGRVYVRPVGQKKGENPHSYFPSVIGAKIVRTDNVNEVSDNLLRRYGGRAREDLRSLEKREIPRAKELSKTGPDKKGFKDEARWLERKERARRRGLDMLAKRAEVIRKPDGSTTLSFQRKPK